MSTQRSGVVYALVANVLWGGMPIYWEAQKPATALEVLPFRIVGSLAFVLLVIVILRRVGHLRALLTRRRAVLLLAGAGAALAVNWGLVIWAVHTGNVVETSFGFFVSPLMTVVVGVTLLRERLRPGQWTAVGIAGIAVVVLTVSYGRLPWIALVLAAFFTLYSLLKNRTEAAPWEGMAVETAALAPVSLAFIVWLQASDRGTLVGHGSWHAFVLLTVGAATAIPLLFFAAGATRVPLVTLGLLQYVSPSVQLLVGVWYFGEALSPARLTGFVLVWIALAVFTTDAIRDQRLRVTAASPRTA